MHKVENRGVSWNFILRGGGGGNEFLLCSDKRNAHFTCKPICMSTPISPNIYRERKIFRVHCRENVQHISDTNFLQLIGLSRQLNNGSVSEVYLIAKKKKKVY
jgi:hypothetical protein